MYSTDLPALFNISNICMLNLSIGITQVIVLTTSMMGKRDYVNIVADLDYSKRNAVDSHYYATTSQTVTIPTTMPSANQAPINKTGSHLSLRGVPITE